MVQEGGLRYRNPNLSGGAFETMEFYRYIINMQNSDKTRNQRVITLRINSAFETMEFYR